MIKEKEKDKKAKKIPFGSLGGKCSACKQKKAIVASCKNPHVSFGDGMAGMKHIDIDIEPPLLCKFCGTPFKAKRESTFIVVFSRIFGQK